MSLDLVLCFCSLELCGAGPCLDRTKLAVLRADCMHIYNHRKRPSRNLYRTARRIARVETYTARRTVRGASWRQTPHGCLTRLPERRDAHALTAQAATSPRTANQHLGALLVPSLHVPSRRLICEVDLRKQNNTRKSWVELKTMETEPTQEQRCSSKPATERAGGADAGGDQS